MTISNKDVFRLKELIASGSANDAIKNIFSVLDSLDDLQKSHFGIKSFYNDLVIVAGNFNNLKNQEIIGVLDRAQISIESNRINKAILTIIDDLQNFSFNKFEEKAPKKLNGSSFEFDIFLCFSSKDLKEAKALWEKLTKHGYSVFMSEEALKFDAGTSFIEKIEFALENSQHFILFCTDNSLLSEWVKTEYETFFNEFYIPNKEKRKIIVYKENAEMAQKVPLLLRRLQTSNNLESIIKSISLNSDKKIKQNFLSEQVYELKETTKELYKIDNRILKDSVNLPLNDPINYIPSSDLIESLNIAVGLGQPLLLSGEPGVGKTQFAYWISTFFNLRAPLVFNVKSTSTVKDLLYIYDEKSHLQQAQISREVLSNEDIENKFISYRALGEAIIRNERTVVLIDEIDMASREFPNDLLDILESLRFEVTEVGKTHVTSGKNRPIIIITTNSEKNLPDAFLQRCIFFFIPQPSEAELFQILKTKFSHQRSDEFLQLVVNMFSEFRSITVTKKPSIGELISWTTALIMMDVNDLKSQNSNNKLLSSLSIIFKTTEDLMKARNILQNKL